MASAAEVGVVEEVVEGVVACKKGSPVLWPALEVVLAAIADA